MRPRAERRQRILQRPFGQRRAVAAPLAQRRQRDAQHRQPVVEVGAEAALAHARLEVAVRRADHPHAHRDRARAADPHHLAFLQHAQQARLQRQRHLADLVEEQGAAVGRFEQARMAAAPRARESAFLVAEQLRLEQRLGHRAAVDRHERPVRAQAARALAVNRLRHQFLAGAGFALDQHRRRRARVQHHRLAQLLHRGRFAAQVVQAMPGAQGVGDHGAPATVRFELGQARHFQRVVERLADRRGGVDEYAGQSRFLGQVGDQTGADDRLDPFCFQFIDAGSRVFLGDVSALRDAGAERRAELGQFRQRRLVGDHADPLRYAACARQRLHHVETAGLGDHHRRRHAALQVGRIGAGGNHHVAAFGRHALADMARRVVETEVDRLDRGQMVVLERDVAKQVGQTRYRDGPDDGAVDFFCAGSGIGHTTIVRRLFHCFRVKRK